MIMFILIFNECICCFKEVFFIVYGFFDNIFFFLDLEVFVLLWMFFFFLGVVGYLGCYFWIDVFGVVNFIILFKEFFCFFYLIFVKRFVIIVYEILGCIWDLFFCFFGVIDVEFLKGGFWIGKFYFEEEDLCDGDGQYYYYLILWMFVFNRLVLVMGDKQWSLLVVQFVKVVYNKFIVRNRNNYYVERMVWKMFIDLLWVLVFMEGYFDVVMGFVVYRFLQRMVEYMYGLLGDLVLEIVDYWFLMGREGKMRVSNDCLDLGMGLWICYFFCDEDWVRILGSQSLEVGKIFLDGKRGVVSRDVNRRLVFWEFGVCLGLRCYGCGVDVELKESVKGVLEFWQ